MDVEKSWLKRRELVGQRKGKAGNRGSKNTHLEPVGPVCQAKTIDSMLEPTWNHEV